MAKSKKAPKKKGKKAKKAEQVTFTQLVELLGRSIRLQSAIKTHLEDCFAAKKFKVQANNELQFLIRSIAVNDSCEVDCSNGEGA